MAVLLSSSRRVHGMALYLHDWNADILCVIYQVVEHPITGSALTLFLHQSVIFTFVANNGNDHLYSMHSWVGTMIIILFTAQYLTGKSHLIHTQYALLTIA